MSSITENLLSQYYGFGRKLDPKKSISSHEVVDSLEVLHENYITDHPIEDAKNGEITEKKNEEKNEEISDARNASGDGPMRPLRVLNEDNLLEENIDTNEYEKFLDSKSIRNDYAFKVNEYLEDSKNQLIGDKITSIDNKIPSRACKESSVDPNFILVKDISLDNTLNISTLEAKKKFGKKFKTSITPLSPAPRKTPSCNGVYLDLAYSEINVFPINMLQEMLGLRMLYLENNKLTELPDVLFSSLRQLQWLDVRHNLLTTLSTNIKGHPCLETILLQGNQIEKLPLELCLVPNLKRLQTTGNPLTFPPEDIVASGCTGVLNFLRNKWNESHPEEIVQCTKDYAKIEPKPSTILCYQPKGSKSRKPAKILSLEKSSETINSATTTVTRTRTRSAREKSFSYRPSNRCESKGTSIMMEQRLMWISKVKEMLSKQELALQRIRNKETLKEWRRDERSFDKSMKRATKRTEEDIPFAIDLNALPLMSRQEMKMQTARSAKRGKRGLISSSNIDEKIRESFKTLNQLEAARGSGTLTPRSEQKLLQVEIKKISDLQDQIENLKRSNEIIVQASFEEPYVLPVSSKGYQRLPSIIF